MVTVIIAAAGQGKRMGQAVNKVFLPLQKCPILVHTLEVFNSCPGIDHILIVTGEEDIRRAQDIVDHYGYLKVRKIVRGGAERQHSVANALEELPEGTKWVVIHDGARPLVSSSLIQQVVEGVKDYKAVGVAVPVKDTIKVVNSEGFIVHTPDRKNLWAIQTPQVFDRNLLTDAYRFAVEQQLLATDDAGLVEALGQVKVKLLMGEYTNIKITTPEDLLFAEAILRRRRDEDRDRI